MSPSLPDIPKLGSRQPSRFAEPPPLHTPRRPSAPGTSVLLVVLALSSAILFTSCRRGSESNSPEISIDSSAIAAGMNLLLITLDTTRMDALSCYGGPAGSTPHLDRIAAEGCRFLQAYSASNATNPSHVSIMTGLRTFDHGVRANFERYTRDSPTLPQLLQGAGYETAGFPAVLHVGEILDLPGWDVFHRAPGRGGSAERFADEMAERFLEWLDSVDPQDSRPFFAWLHFFDPHALYNPPPEIAKRFYSGDPKAGSAPLYSEKPYFSQVEPSRREWVRDIRDESWPRAMYAGEVHFVDQQIGRVLEELSRRGLDEKTVLVVVGDHGEAIDHHELLFTHSGLWEDTIRVPLLIRVPGLPQGIEEKNLPVGHVDLLPTLQELLGLPRSPTSTTGQTLVPSLTGKTPPTQKDRAPLFFEGAKNYQIAIRKGRWKLVWTLIEKHDRIPLENFLFDLESDPEETENLFFSRPEIVDELRPLLEPWIKAGIVKPRKSQILNERVLKELEALGYKNP